MPLKGVGAGAVATKAYSSRSVRLYLRRRQIEHRPGAEGPAGRRRRGGKGGRPMNFDTAIYRRRNEVGRTINALKSFRAVAIRFDERA